MAVTVW